MTSVLTEKKAFDCDCSLKCGNKCLRYDGFCKRHYDGQGDNTRHHLVTGYPCPGLKSGKTFARSHRVSTADYVAHGRGELRDESGQVVYAGGWADGYRHGVGEGWITAGDKACGFKAEGRYHGEWRAGLRDGFGVYVDDNSGKYEGEWKHDLKHGKGVEYYHNGGRYHGQWRHGKRHGCGQVVYSSGRVEDREYDNGSVVSVSADQPSALEKKLVSAMDLNDELARQKDASAREMREMYAVFKDQLNSTEDGPYKTRVKELEQNLKDTQSNYVCRICYDKPRNAVVLPCLHFLYCRDCIYRHEHATKTCPTCQVEIKAILVCKVGL
eukprot:GFYU01008674.1.p1 GENE.GFYU01008674.1~~GFYU01008674.1.p1  ORF type:complete len:326 (-),score=78.31 GFYU01008674.1:189-1166(-)